ncbi:hypothetical protein GLYMA_06G149160v4 [Glycine max]|nr:hypothetical protein GLYMA_06G149160v4 [Glycine max]KAH1125977.1 hypothetical protein GYH30_015147 [Glycine max]
MQFTHLSLCLYFLILQRRLYGNRRCLPLYYKNTNITHFKTIS